MAPLLDMLLSDLEIYNLESITLKPCASASIRTGADTSNNSEKNLKKLWLDSQI